MARKSELGLAPRIGVRDVARKAGVSVATVSRVFNTPDRVRPALRRQVADVAAALRYIPDPGARALASQKTWRVGALIPTIDNSIFAAVMTAMQRYLTAAGYGLLIGVTEFDARTEASELHSLIGSGVDGVILTGAQRHDDIYDELQTRGLPYVLTSIYLPKSSHPTVGYDNREGGRVLASYLADLGHIHIGMVAGPCAVNDRAALRKAGVRDGLTARGLTLPDSRIIDRPFSLADGRDGLRHLLSIHPELTAVVCGNDVLAMGALFQVQAQGLSVPEDISIVGFDGLDMGMHVRPGLTTIDVHCDRMGAGAAESLLARIEGKIVPHAAKIDFDFVVRGSSGRPRV